MGSDIAAAIGFVLVVYVLVRVLSSRRPSRRRSSTEEHDPPNAMERSRDSHGGED